MFIHSDCCWSPAPRALCLNRNPLPADYLRRAAIRLVLRPKTFYSNALDLALLERFITAQVPRYVDLRTPTVIITGDRDTMVSPQINARALAAVLPRAKLVLLKDIGHMSHHAAPDVVAAAVDELLPNAVYPFGRSQRLLTGSVSKSAA